MPGKTDQELIEEAKRRRAESEQEADALKLRGFGLSESASPDEAAKALDLARKNGVPRVSVETDMKGYQALDELERVDRATKSAPALRKWLADGEDNYAIARDDVENLGLLEQAINLGRSLSPQSGSWNGAASTITKFAFGTPQAAKQGIMDMRTQAYGEGLRYIEPVGDYAERMDDWQSRQNERRILQRNPDGTMSLSLGNLVRQTAGAMGVYDNVKSPTIDRMPERPLAASLLGGQNLSNESEYLKAWADVLEPWQEALATGAEASAKEADALNPDTGDFVADSALSGVRSLTNMALAILVASRGGPTAGASVMGAQVQGQSYAESRFLSGLGVQDAVEKSNADAAIELATERISLGILDDIIASNKPVLQKFLAGMTAEQIQEQAATFGQDFVDWQIVNPEKTAQDFLMERPERAAQTAIATLVASGGMQGALMGLDSLLGQRERGAQVDQTQQAFQQMRDLVEKSPVFTRSREAVRDFVEQASEGQTVHLDDEGVTQLYQSSPEAFARLMEQLGLDSQETYLKAAQGNDIEVSAADILTLKERSDFDALTDIVRTSPEAMTPAEVRAQAESNALNVDLEDLQARMEDDLQALEGFERVQQSVQQQLLDAGRSPQEAEAGGVIWGAIFRRFAEDGLDEAQVFERLGLRIEGAGQQAGRQPAMQEPQSLLSFVKARGGIRESFGQDERGYMRGEMQAITGANLPGLINNKGGQTLDEMAMLAREAGYDIADDQAFIDAMQRELGGQKVYRTGEGEAWQQYQESKAKAQQGDAETLNLLYQSSRGEFDVPEDINLNEFNLSKRQKNVAQLILDGVSLNEAADTLGLTYTQVKGDVSEARKKGVPFPDFRANRAGALANTSPERLRSLYIEGMTQAEIGAALSVDSTTAGRALNKLKDSGIITQEDEDAAQKARDSRPKKVATKYDSALPERGRGYVDGDMRFEPFSDPRLSDRDNKIVEMARNGAGIPDMAEEWGIAERTVQLVLQSAREKGIDVPYAAASAGSPVMDRVLQLEQKGLTTSQIAELTGMNRPAVYETLRRAAKAGLYTILRDRITSAFDQGYSVAEIAAQTNKYPGTVRWHLWQAGRIKKPDNSTRYEAPQRKASIAAFGGPSLLFQSAPNAAPAAETALDRARREAELANAELDKEAQTVRQMLQEAAACAAGAAPAGVGQMVAGIGLATGAGIPLGIVAGQMTPQAQAERERRMKDWNLQEHQRLMREDPEYRAAHEQYDARRQAEYDNALAEYRAAREFEQKLEAYSDIDNMPMDSQFDMNSWTEQVSGVSGEFLDDLIGHEAAGDWNAEAGTSTAKGGGQFIDSTWLRLMRQHGLELGLDPGMSKEDMLALRTDRRWGTMMTAYYAMENRAVLEKKLDRPVTQKDAYLAHFLGATAAAKALTMDQEADAAKAFPAAAEANQNVFYKYGNPENPRTVGEMIERQTKGFSAEPLMVWDYPQMIGEADDGRVDR